MNKPTSYISPSDGRPNKRLKLCINSGDMSSDEQNSQYNLQHNPQQVLQWGRRHDKVRRDCCLGYSRHVICCSAQAAADGNWSRSMIIHEKNTTIWKFSPESGSKESSIERRISLEWIRIEESRIGICISLISCIVFWETITRLVGSQRAPLHLPALATPGRVGCDGHLPTSVHLRVIDVQLQCSPFVGFYESKQILTVVQHWICSNDVVREPVQPGHLCWWVRMHLLQQQSATNISSTASKPSVLSFNFVYSISWTDNWLDYSQQWCVVVLWCDGQVSR